jgi:hypothetical protein
MGANPPPSAQDEPAPPNRPRRLWDANRCIWIEPQTVCRDPLGRYANKCGNEPFSQLVLPFGSQDAA